MNQKDVVLFDELTLPHYGAKATRVCVCVTQMAAGGLAALSHSCQHPSTSASGLNASKSQVAFGYNTRKNAVVCVSTLT